LPFGRITNWRSEPAQPSGPAVARNTGARRAGQGRAAASGSERSLEAPGALPHNEDRSDAMARHWYRGPYAMSNGASIFRRHDDCRRRDRRHRQWGVSDPAGRPWAAFANRRRGRSRPITVPVPLAGDCTGGTERRPKAGAMERQHSPTLAVTATTARRAAIQSISAFLSTERGWGANRAFAHVLLPRPPSPHFSELTDHLNLSRSSARSI
jgi:hypothetical protein